MVATIWTLLTLTPREARIAAAALFLAVFVIDVIASGDETPGNTPRELILKGSQARKRFWCGACLPFLFGVVIGHFFHPWAEKPFDWGWGNLAVVLALGIVPAVLFWRRARNHDPAGGIHCGWLGVLGVVAGVLLWPSG